MQNTGNSESEAVSNKEQQTLDTDGDEQTAPLQANANASSQNTPLEDGDYVIQSAYSPYVIDVNECSLDSGANVQIYEYNATGAQKWHVAYEGNGMYSIANIKSGKVLGVAATTAANCANVCQQTPNSSLGQYWKLSLGSKGFTIISALDEAFVLDVYGGSARNGTNIEIYQAHDGAPQLFSFVRIDIDGRDVDETSKGYLAPGTYVIQSALGGYVVDVNGCSKDNGANVQLWEYNGTDAQIWEVGVDDGGFYSFKNAASGKMLDLAWGNAWYETNLQQYESNDSLAQKWVLRPHGEFFTIASAADPLFVVDVMYERAANGANLQSYYDHNAAGQRFMFIPVGTIAAGDNVLANGTYTIAVKQNESFMVDINGCSLSDSANAQIWEANNSYAQRWGVVRTDSGYYTLFNLASGKHLDVARANPLACANVQQYQANSSLAQKWILISNDDGISYTLKSAISGMVLDVCGGKIANGSNLITYAAAPGSLQQFIFKPCEVVSDGAYHIYSTLNVNYAVDVPGASAADGEKLEMYAANDSLAQRVYVSKCGEDLYALRPVNSGRYLTDEGGNVVQRSNQSSAAQQWCIALSEHGISFVNEATGKVIGFNASSPSNGRALVTRGSIGANTGFSIAPCPIIADGIYRFDSAASKSGRVLDVEYASWAEDAKTELYAGIRSSGQKFILSSTDDGFFRISLALARTYVTASDVADEGDSATSLGTTSMKHANGSDFQLWLPVIGDGGIAFINKATGLVFEVKEGIDANGTDIDQGIYVEALPQLWNLFPDRIDLTDTGILTKLVWAAPGVSYVTASFDMDQAAYQNLLNILNACWAQSFDVGFIMTDLQTGDYIALNADKTYYGASTMKGPYVTWIFQNLLETGAISWDSVGYLILPTIEYSNNDTYASLRQRYGSWGFNSWLESVGVYMGDRWYNWYSPRTLQLMWARMLAYEQSGGAFVSTWQATFNHSYYSSIYYGLGSYKTTYSKPGWYSRGTGYDSLDDSGIIVGSDGKRYLLTIMSDIDCDRCLHYEQNIATALDGIFAARR